MGTAAANVDPYVLVDPRDPYPGTLSVLARQSRMTEIDGLQTQRQRRVWRVRGIISDYIPLIGDADAILARPPYHNFHLLRSPLSIYLHSGGDRAVYYDLVSNQTGQLDYIEVRVSAELPSDALVSARRPLNALLDNFAVNSPMPLLIQRLDLISPSDGATLLHELVLPFRGRINMGPLGGIDERTPFVQYDAIFREAITNTSPYYRLLCAYRIYDGVNEIRRWLREQCQARNIETRLPGVATVDREELLRLGFVPEFVEGLRTVADLFDRLRDTRDAIAHFLIERDEANIHVYLSDGGQLRTYSVGSAALLKYARLLIDELRNYYVQNLEQHFRRGSILPTLENRDRFIVRG